MESVIAKYIGLKNSPVAVLWGDDIPKDAICFKEDTWGCVVALIKAASNGKIAAATLPRTVCRGGRAGLGFAGYELGQIEYFLSTGNENMTRCERYKKTEKLCVSCGR